MYDNLFNKGVFFILEKTLCSEATAFSLDNKADKRYTP